MASIQERKFNSGAVTYRVRLRRRGWPSFSLTFDSLAEAAAWVKENEERYFDNTTEYAKWRKDLYYDMQATGKQVQDNILKPKNYPTKLVETGSKSVGKYRKLK